MTGYGQASKEFKNGRYTVEIKSLNSKFLELNLKLPKAYSDKEFFLRNECSRLIERGKVILTLTVENNNEAAKAATINQPLLAHYYISLKNIAAQLGETGENLMALAVTFPDVIKYDDAAVSEDEWKNALHAFNKAVTNFNIFRADEGKVLMNDFILRINNILDFMAGIERQEPARILTVRDRLTTYLTETIGKDNVDNNRLEQELIYYIDKLDITEEKVRLKSHCHYFLQTLNEPDAGGKKLGFITQEIGREINTIGSKANNADIQKMVVGMKEELEKMKEQLLNVL
ncbi:MAG: YicC family protein [Sphingobacteriales bacterium]|nr:MAG: YicC family protein [Sphingobacteriales bacterium]TAF81696.1 MAG: YicC family protein [Sphingobacteriales bacterium]